MNKQLRRRINFNKNNTQHNNTQNNNTQGISVQPQGTNTQESKSRTRNKCNHLRHLVKRGTTSWWRTLKNIVPNRTTNLKWNSTYRPSSLQRLNRSVSKHLLLQLITLVTSSYTVRGRGRALNCRSRRVIFWSRWPSLPLWSNHRS